MDHEIKVQCKETDELIWIEKDLFDPKKHIELEDEEPDLDPSWADGDALASAGFGTDEDYGAY